MSSRYFRFHVPYGSALYQLLNPWYTHRNSDYTEEVRYSSDLGQKTHDWNAQGKGRSLKIGNDMPLAEYIEDKIAAQCPIFIHPL